MTVELTLDLKSSWLPTSASFRLWRSPVGQALATNFLGKKSQIGAQPSRILVPLQRCAHPSSVLLIKWRTSCAKPRYSWSMTKSMMSCYEGLFAFKPLFYSNCRCLRFLQSIFVLSEAGTPQICPSCHHAWKLLFSLYAWHLHQLLGAKVVECLVLLCQELQVFSQNILRYYTIVSHMCSGHGWLRWDSSLKS